MARNPGYGLSFKDNSELSIISDGDVTIPSVTRPVVINNFGENTITFPVVPDGSITIKSEFGTATIDGNGAAVENGLLVIAPAARKFIFLNGLWGEIT